MRSFVVLVPGPLVVAVAVAADVEVVGTGRTRELNNVLLGPP